MKKILIAIAALALMTTACKTSEANYRAAYEKAVEAREADQSVDSTIYGNIRRQADTSTVEVEPGISTDVRSQLVRITEGGGGIRENLHRYCVIVGQFKQKFNAISLRDRLAEAGHPAAFVVETAEPYYYIVLGSYDDLKQAYDAMQAINAKPPVPMKAPLPFLLRATAR